MKDIQFSIFKTKIDDSSKKFDLTDFNQRQVYFEFKAGKEIKKLREYLKEKTFIVYFLGKKNSGKGTYAKMFKEVVDKDRVEHFSIGDMIRELDSIWENEDKKKELVSFLEKNNRGFLALDKVLESLQHSSTKNSRFLMYPPYIYSAPPAVSRSSSIYTISYHTKVPISGLYFKVF